VSILISYLQLAVIGPNSKVATFCGGGSASLWPYRAVTPFEALSNKTFTQGCYSHKEMPLLDKVLETSSGKPGFSFKIFGEPPTAKDRKCVEELHLLDTNMFMMDYRNDQLKNNLFYGEFEGYLTPTEDSPWEFGLAVCGTARLFVDDVEVIDNATKQEPGRFMFGTGTSEVRGTVQLSAGKRHKIVVEFGSAPTTTLKGLDRTAFGKGGLRLGGCPKWEPTVMLDNAEKLASEYEQVVVFIGLNVSTRIHCIINWLTD
jgi:beta-glucosidase